MRMDDIGCCKRFPVGWGLVAKPCDSCNVAAALLFCRTDSAYMCIGCDTKVHGTRRHERVWMCEVCEQAPASVTCKADAAALCVTCDRDIHSANPLARRHERILVVPFYDAAESVVKSTATAFVQVPAIDESNSGEFGNHDAKRNPCMAREDNGGSSWLHQTNHNNSKLLTTDINIHPDMKSMELLFSDPDNLLELEYPTLPGPRNLYNNRNSGTDSVVPVQISKPLPPPQQLVDQSEDNHFEIDFTASNISSFNNYTDQSICQTVSSSSMDVGVVPDGGSMSDMSSYPFALQMNGSANLNNNGSTDATQGSKLMGIDREARVMRYKEKRKNRKFEKTIRYASRKAYAETRPRIKGRFAKRTETESDGNRGFTPKSTDFMGEFRYGVVPSIL